MENLLKLTDEQLVSSYIQGNNEAFNTLLSRYESKVFSYIAYSVRNQEIAEDLFQDAFMRIINTLRSGKYTEQQKFSSWIMRISHNLIIDYFRHNSNNATISNDESEVDLFNNVDLADDHNAEHAFIKRQTSNGLEEIINMLPECQRTVIRMRYYQDLSFKEIADMTGVSINTALGRVRYALINLRKLAGEYNISLAS
ncbi:MAG: sigma-70 family RNA polymerase sigma factor [Bacteroidaceae bacterium]|nr:sigma-70 family RNA polymerase sigma factor [Bacteroidaceae bacterium]MCR4769446.1 sigma-70 family RNA polymerase sigma factor [Bacteroidaceae bacterium]